MTLHRTLTKRTDTNTWDEILRFITGGYYLDAQHWLHGPGVVSKPIPESGFMLDKNGALAVNPKGSPQPFIQPRSAVLHTNAGSKGAKSLWSYITQASVTGEPHFQVGYQQLEQYMPLNRRADCNYSVNRWFDAPTGRYYGAISFETQDNGAATLDRTPWTLEQINHMAGALTAIGVCYGVMCTAPATWDGSGIGHHTLFPFQGVGKPAWTNVRGKTCPGAARIRQMDHVRSRVAENMAAFVRETGFRCGQTGGV